MARSKYLILALLLLACNTNTYTQPLLLKGYDWSSMKKIHLEHKLDEVSGLVFDNKSSSLLAINDERGKVYRIGVEDYKIKQTMQFGKDSDYEAIILRKNMLYVMNSKGWLWGMKFTGNEVKQVVKYKSSFEQKIEFEAMVWSERETIFLISKNSRSNKEKKKTLVYSFNINSKQYDGEPAKEIAWADINAKSPIKSLHVSGAAIHPNTKNVYLVASIEKLLIILNKDWEVAEVHTLDKKLFKQPEGIAFDNKGNLYISNEAREGRPNIIKIPIKK